MCGPSVIGDQHTLGLRVRVRLDQLFTDGEWRGSEERGVESLFNTNRFAQLVLSDGQTDGSRVECWLFFTTQRTRGGEESRVTLLDS